MKAAADNGMTLTEADFYYCRKCCTDKVIASYDYSEGFAGGGIDFYTLSCGHTECDDSSDVAAAR